MKTQRGYTIIEIIQLGMYLLIAVEATSLAKRTLPRKVWRSVHLVSFVLFVFSTVHAIQSGTDLANTFVRIVGLTLLGVTMGAAVSEANSNNQDNTIVLAPGTYTLSPTLGELGLVGVVATLVSK